MVSSFTSLDTSASFHTNKNIFYFLVQSKLVKMETRQPYSDSSLDDDCSLLDPSLKCECFLLDAVLVSCGPSYIGPSVVVCVREPLEAKHM